MLKLQMFEWPRWAQMWALAFALYFGCKWLTWQQAPIRGTAAWKHPAYLLAWPGMDAASFLLQRPRTDHLHCPPGEWFTGIAKLASGAFLLFGVARLIPDRHAYFAGWLGGTGVVLILHFGLFHLLSCGWRRIGIPAPPLMNRPLTSATLSEFWGRRWNTAFRDLTHRLVFRPCTSRFGTRAGLAVSFLVSGAIHDLVISLPARGGYGGPTIYFAIQGLGVLAERSAFGGKVGLQAGISARVFAFLILLAPAPLLFHRPFMHGVMLPFMRALGAL